MRARTSAFAFITVCLAACGSGFEPASRIEKLRLLALAADPPSARAGETVELSVLHHDPEQRALRWGFALCPDAPSSAALDCALSVAPDTLVVRDTPDFSFRMPTTPAGARATAVGVLIVACPGELGPGDTMGIPLACKRRGAALGLAEFEIGVKRVFVRNAAQNGVPEIADLTFDGEAWPPSRVLRVSACAKGVDELADCDASVRHRVAVRSERAAETYVDAQGARVREQAVVQFYGTGGMFEYETRVHDAADNAWAARHDERGETHTLYFVLRDSRGGVSWTTRAVQVE